MWNTFTKQKQLALSTVFSLPWSILNIEGCLYHIKSIPFILIIIISNDSDNSISNKQINNFLEKTFLRALNLIDQKLHNMLLLRAKLIFSCIMNKSNFQKKGFCWNWDHFLQNCKNMNIWTLHFHFIFTK